MDLLIPPFLKHVKITKSDVWSVSPFIKNWLRLLDNYKELDIEGLEKCIVIELNYKQRKAVLDRLLGRYAKLKKQTYVRELELEIGEPFKTGHTRPVNAEINKMIEEGSFYGN